MTQTLIAALIRSARQFGGAYEIAEDITRKPITYRQLLTQVLALSAGLKPCEGQTIGMLLPNSLPTVVTFFALQFLGKTPAMLNASASTPAIEAAVRMANVQTILTSKTFIEKADLEPLIDTLKQTIHVVYLENIKPKISLRHKLSAALRARFPWSIRTPKTEAQAPAVILFTSGSEGLPKGVALSHANILANVTQVSETIRFSKTDRMFSSLPIFHSFGLTVSTILPLLLGVRAFFYPTPLHYKIIPGLIKDTGSTIILGTDTFYKGYAHYANSDDFATVRLAIAGAEKLRDATFNLYQERFNTTIYQGYGVTETSPVISCNTPENHKIGTVGKLFPHQQGRVEPVEGITSGGRLLIKGPNVMLGYLTIANPGIIESPGPWHDTGDVVEVDSEGYIRIIGRAKRFAKIGGEMVSLAAVEDFAASLKPDHAHAAVAAPDETKGEHIVLYTECEALSRSDLIKHARTLGYAEIGLPKIVTHMKELPKLGSGKVDYLRLKESLLF